VGEEAADLHEWVSFEDPEEDRTWIFDVTFLTSRWTCIFGRGCQGVLTGPAPELVQGCCSYGAHFTSDEDRARVTAAAATLTAEQWQHKALARRRGGIAVRQHDGSWRTRLTGDACIFLNGPDFAGGAGCALHRAAAERGEHYIHTKPDVCWQLPLRRVDSTDENGHVTSTVREWKRRDWGEGGAEFHWWCTEADDAFVGGRPVYQEMRDELVEMTGEEPYRLLVEHLEAREAEGTVWLPHPAVRRRAEAR
jgi:hypothetical protein